MSQVLDKKFLEEAGDYLMPIIKKAGEMSLEMWDKIEISKQKDSRDIATKADVEIENFLKGKIIAKWPDHGFWGEEGEERVNPASPYQWMVDPLDQTKLYVKQVPIFYVQIALVFEGKPILGLIYSPASKQLFSASEGGGTYFNNKRIMLESSNSLDKAIIDVDFGGLGGKGQGEKEWMLKKLEKIAEKSYRTRMSGGALAIYLATGAFDAYVDLSGSSKPQDLAARIIIMQEAGYKVEWLENPFGKKILIVSQEPLLSELKEIITG